MADTEKLDNDFQNLLHQIESFMPNYNYREKFLITTWLTKLKKSNASVEERKVRNRFMNHFVSNLEETDVNIFQIEPFKNIPKDLDGPLMALKKLLPKNDDEEATESERRSYLAELFRSLPDKGTFLAEQPVPRNGSFSIQVMRPVESVVCGKT